MTDTLTERDLARIYKSDYTPMSPTLIDALWIDTYVWFQQYAPNASISDVLRSGYRILGYDLDRSIPFIKERSQNKRNKQNTNSLKTNSETEKTEETGRKKPNHPPGMSDRELIEYYLKERRERGHAVET